ncbi:MAG: hypothetical protein HY617_03475 [Candidatus Sungbacteria bacterium]|nr:hypothetical protein [Candidatus Sungbacteria bacterium]
MAEQTGRQQQRRQFDPLSVTPFREAGRYRFLVVIYDRDRKRVAGETVTLAAAGRPDVHAVTDPNGEANLYVSFLSTTTVVISAVGETKTFPDLAGFASASTNFRKPAKSDTKGLIFSGLVRVFKKARAQRKIDTGR